jgi:hypothetical protein
VYSKCSKCTGAFSKSGFYTLLLPWIHRGTMTFTVLRNSCTLYTFTVLRQKALAFTLPPPYAQCSGVATGAAKNSIPNARAGRTAKKSEIENTEVPPRAPLARRTLARPSTYSLHGKGGAASTVRIDHSYTVIARDPHPPPTVSSPRQAPQDAQLLPTLYCPWLPTSLKECTALFLFPVSLPPHAWPSHASCTGTAPRACMHGHGP